MLKNDGELNEMSGGLRSSRVQRVADPGTSPSLSPAGVQKPNLLLPPVPTSFCLLGQTRCFVCIYVFHCNEYTHTSKLRKATLPSTLMVKDPPHLNSSNTQI